jgi:phosphoribosylaminoimidazole (AIR) synthetase
MIVIVDKEQADNVTRILQREGETVTAIGSLAQGDETVVNYTGTLDLST